MGTCETAAAQFVSQPVDNPRVLEGGRDVNGIVPGPERPRGEREERELDLKIVYTDGFIANPATGLKDKVRLRSYNGTDVDPTTPYVAPTIEMKPGETLRINLQNQLPADPTCAQAHSDANIPHCFNGTNLHTHGLWVNPEGNGDNVLLSINPGVSFQYEYHIPSDHPAGTFWYHTHRHGSTAMQVSSGMAGALIVRGDRLPAPDRHGDIDTLLKGFKERVLVFQQIQYSCREPSSNGQLGPIKKNADGTYRCDEGDVGGIENYDIDQFGPATWGASGRYTTINGLVIPTFKARSGDVERWRMIHGGVRDTISLKIVKMTSPLRLTPTFTKASAAAFLKESCTGAVVPQQVVAADGLTMAAAQRHDLTTFQPGYRFDAMLVFPEAGQYCVFNASAPSAGSVNGIAPGPEMLGIVDVAQGPRIANPQTRLRDALIARAAVTMPARVRAAVVADLRADLKFSNFTPHPDIAEADVTGRQDLTFFIDLNATPISFRVSNTASAADAKSYDPARIDRELVLGSVDEWTLRSELAGHPFHIHVNPFQIVSITDPNGRDVSAPGAVDDADGTVDPQYAGLKGVWKDTLWVKNDGRGLPGVYKVIVRTRYQRYIGQFVLHCHILDHEDQGMMQNVAIILPTGQVANSGTGAQTLSKHRH